MYKVLKRTCWAIFLPIRSFVFPCPRWHENRDGKLLIKFSFGTQLWNSLILENPTCWRQNTTAAEITALVNQHQSPNTQTRARTRNSRRAPHDENLRLSRGILTRHNFVISRSNPDIKVFKYFYIPFSTLSILNERVFGNRTAQVSVFQLRGWRGRSSLQLSLIRV